MKRPVRLALLVLVALAGSSTSARAQSEVIEYYGLDALGSVRVIFNAQGNVVDRMDYGPFGENLRAAIKFPVEQFAQLARDGESGQDYAQARNYAPSTGRFSRVDPIYAGLFEPQLWNRYAYARNNPIRFTDPTGLCVPGDCKPEYSLNFLAFYFTFGAYPPVYGEEPPQRPQRERKEREPANTDPDTDSKEDPETPKEPDPCVVPPAPEGVDMKTNVQGARAHFHYIRSQSHPVGYNDIYGWWVESVSPGGSWDYKVTHGTQYEDLGNFNYGATGRAGGIPAWVLRGAAGAVSIWARPRRLLDGSVSPFRWWDDARDQEQINAGIAYAEAGCDRK